MGIWGVKLYQNDIGDDVQAFYKDQLRRGLSGPEITKRLIEENQELLADEDDASDFWYALADTQWKMGRLEDLVKKSALHFIENGAGLRRWQNSGHKTLTQREQVLQELKERLQTPQPPEKKVSQYRLYRCQWKLGDVYAYPLESEVAQEAGIMGSFLLLHKVGETTWWPGHIIPVVRVKFALSLPASETEFDSLDYLQVSQCHPVCFLQGYKGGMYVNGEEVEVPLTNKYGEIPEYCLKLLNTSSRTIPKKLVYIGNYTDIRVPAMEYISPMGDIPGYAWSHFESVLIRLYQKFGDRSI